MNANIVDEDWGDPAEWAIDAGLVPKEPRGEIHINDHDLMTMSQEELRRLNQLSTQHLHANQYVREEDDSVTGDIILAWKYVTPCITYLEEKIS